MKHEMNQMVGYHINLVSHFMQNQYNRNLSELGLTMAQAKVLYLLFNDGSQSQSELQKRLFIKGSTMNGIIESMQKRELISKSDSLEDRRTKIIALTEKGRLLEEKLWHEMSQLDQELVTGFSKEEQEVLISWLKRMQNNIHVEKENSKGEGE